MSKTDAWMPLYIGDYLADTMHLSGPEHGAYLLLLMHYWRNGPLLDDDKALAGIARTDRKVWERDIGPAVRAFFVAEGGRLHQKRMDSERERAGEISSKRKAAADARWAAKSEQAASIGDANADANAFQMDTHAGARPSASPSQSQEQKKEEVSFASLTPSARAAPRRRVGLSKTEIDEQFEIWWDNYPRKVGRGDARKAYERALPKVEWDAERLLTPMLLAQFDKRDGCKFVPHGSTWLNSERWLDGDAPRAQPDHNPSLPLH
jgi:uncharacterized protein YdaU (DUF1376 family)